MKNEIIVPLLREEDFVAADKRRDTYALKRDIQAQESNLAIITRMLAEEKNQIRCDKCGKAFPAGKVESFTSCPACR